jgi:ABC-2 type transport system ATP-binding protein
MEISETICSVVELEQVSKIYGGTAVLDEVSMTIQNGTATALIGRNGSGKSTMMSIMAGLVQPTKGSVILKNKGMTIGYAPENFPGLKFTPEEYLQSVGRLYRLAPAELNTRITELLACFRLESFRSKAMLSFSKGMLQKVNLIQSMLAEPSLLLLDEPMSGLDASAQEALVQLVLRAKQKGTVVLFSVHEPQWIEAMADKVLALQDGRIVRTVNRSDLQSSSSSIITCTGLPLKLLTEMKEWPGFLSSEAPEQYVESERLVISVDHTSCDLVLKLILEAGGSILSVERRGELAGLELWMSPQHTSVRRT